MLLSYGTSRKTRSFFYLGQAKHGKKRFKKNSISQIKERSVFDMMANNCVVWGHTPPLALGSVCSTPPPFYRYRMAETKTPSHPERCKE
jgi:hypothetical protein